MSKESRATIQNAKYLKKLNDNIKEMNFYNGPEDIKIPDHLVNQEQFIPVYEILFDIDRDAAQAARIYVKSTKVDDVRKALESFSSHAIVSYFNGGMIIDEKRQRTDEEYKHYINNYKATRYKQWKHYYDAAIKRRDEFLAPPDPRQIELEKLAQEMGYKLQKQ